MTSDHMSVYAVGVFVAKQQRLVASFEAAQAAATTSRHLNVPTDTVIHTCSEGTVGVAVKSVQWSRGGVRRQLCEKSRSLCVE
jgi:hypothetical protein